MRARLPRSVCLALLLLPLHLHAGVADNPDVKGAERLFESWLRGQMAYRALPGIAIGVVNDQDLVWARGFGYADTGSKTPVTPATKFRMASHSKLFTATAIMQLREAGKLRLDDPVSQHLPWFRIRSAEPDDPPITIEELLTHSSGLPREAGPHWSTLQFPAAAEVQSHLREQQAAYPPEVRFKYSNLAFTVAGLIVESLSGEGWGAYVEKHIFAPLGMSQSSVDRNVEGLATGSGRRMPDGSREKMPFVDAVGMAAATGITSTVEDMAKFVSLQFRKGKPGGSQILGTGALREMHRVRMLENNWTRGNAIGFAVNRDKDTVFVGHGGSYFGFKTHTLIQLDDKVGVIVLTNGDDSAPSDIAMHLMRTVGAAARKAARPAAKEILWDPSWSRFSGLYRGRFGDQEVIELNRALVVLDPSGSSPEPQIRLIPTGNGHFRAEGATGGGAIGEAVRFVEENGRVVRMYIGEGYTDRVTP
ncbi:MAG: serine hydrolase domain-containing protein [Bryobacteraceae bacterium]